MTRSAQPHQTRLHSPDNQSAPQTNPPHSDTDALNKAPSTARPEVGAGRSRSSYALAEAQAGERGDGVRVGGRLGHHSRLELRLGPGEG